MKVTDLNDMSPGASENPPDLEGVYFIGGVWITFKNLMQKEVTMSGKKFRILKMLATEAKDLWNRTIRPCVSSFGGVQFHETPGETGKLVPRPWPIILLEVFGRIPYENLEMMSEIFQKRSIEFYNNGTWMKVALDPGQAFHGLDPAELVMLDMMAFAQNFEGSVAVIGRNFLVQFPTAAGE